MAGQKQHWWVWFPQSAAQRGAGQSVIGLETLEDRTLPSVNPAMPDFSTLRNDLAQLGNDLSTSAIALVKAVQSSPTNTLTAASIQSQWGQAWSVFAADLSKTYQAFVLIEDDALALIGQEFNLLLFDLGFPLPDQSSSSSLPAAPPTSATPAPPIQQHDCGAANP